jgi:hypothetical protein
VSVAVYVRPPGRRLSTGDFCTFRATQRMRERPPRDERRRAAGARDGTRMCRRRHTNRLPNPREPPIGAPPIVTLKSPRQLDDVVPRPCAPLSATHGLEAGFACAVRRATAP